MQNTHGIPYRTLGRTGEQVSLIGLGGFHLGFTTVDEAEAIEMVHTALDNGVNVIDSSWDYNDGVSEIRIGKALRGGYRQKAFLLTKFDGQTSEIAKRQFEESLERLGTDHVDLVMIHEIARLDDADLVFGPGGAIEYALSAREAGLTRYIGFSGHFDPKAHLRMLEAASKYGFAFDVVLMPLNAMDPHFKEKSFQNTVLPLAVEQGLGIIAIKSIGAGSIRHSHTLSPIECMQYVMNLPVSVMEAGCESMAQLQQALDTAKTFRPLSDDVVASMLKRTAEAGAHGEFEPYKTEMTSDQHYWVEHDDWFRPV
jgi:uncharacterized protein